ncbi:MAG: redoxin domain-containing protein [Tannerella sp.]|jgi:hypothetical protein|nr:redoxin domain-containing protein [Tannerella sp.]
MKVNYILTGLLLLGLYSCRPVSETEKEMKQFLGSKVDLPNTLVQQLPIENDFYLIIYLEAEDCIPCSLNKVTLLDRYRDDLKKFNTSVVLIIKENDNREQIKELFAGMKIEYPFFFDKDDYLLENNHIISTNPLCHTFIIDKNMKIIWIGSPVANAKSIERYRKMMKMICNDR